MDLLIIGGLLGVAILLVKSLLAPAPEQSSPRRVLPSNWHSDSRQLRIEYHQSVDESLSPPMRQ
jgi:hypothetical protein